MITGWDDMNRIWDHAFFAQLDLDPRDAPDQLILLTDPALNPTAIRERVFQNMFEKYGFGGVNIQVQAVLTLYALGLRTGTVVDSGDGVTHVMAVIDGYVMQSQTKRLNIAGRHVTSYLLDLLRRRGCSLDSSADMETVSLQKETPALPAASLDGVPLFQPPPPPQFANETTACVESYVLPDGKVLRLGAERFTAPEVLFTPSMVDSEAPGIAQMTFNAINEASMDVRRRLYEHIVISGGSSMYPGLPDRMQSDIVALHHERVLRGQPSASAPRIRVQAPANRRHLVFQGAAVLASIMQDDPSFWVSRQEYQEDPYRAMMKCSATA
ncbi:MAG: hypothetical protein WDW36_010058 [Sanguina aurantia]